MAVIIYKQPEGTLLPAYNNAIIEFGSDTAMAARALVKVGTFTFELTPNQGVFYINLKDVITLLFNQNAFADTVSVPVPSTFLYPDANLYLEQEVILEVILYDGQVETFTQTFSFVKAVAQQLLPLFTQNNLLRVLVPSDSSTKQVTYFEGLPMDVALYSNSVRTVQLTHVATGTTVSVNILKGVNRLFLSNGETGQGFEAQMPLFVGLNEITITVDTTHSSSLFITKRETDCGVYLKWLNASGGWSYWRFHKYYEESLKTSDLDTINNDFFNLEEAQSGQLSRGKETERSLKLSSGFLNKEEKLLVSELFAAPKVYYYHQEPMQPFALTDWKEVNVKSGSYAVNNTRLQKVEFRPVIELPMQYAQTYAGRSIF
ncbi:hypothetical protein [Neptunitalea lumnitzerae]|uniref:Uncharacterized protein n=1 Tax=Neptunitalea lumnitzerae TaxID=2965509 RepID=A0ABQ5MEJ3_9FLAO|nr:hypothetical protein [Neptunitalea sp. Y10]GLB47767.1 hypothetical protein Y10_01350 [Neptunitalea sp. Y10]